MVLSVVILARMRTESGSPYVLQNLSKGGLNEWSGWVAYRVD